MATPQRGWDNHLDSGVTPPLTPTDLPRPRHAAAQRTDRPTDTSRPLRHRGRGLHRGPRRRGAVHRHLTAAWNTLTAAVAGRHRIPLAEHARSGDLARIDDLAVTDRSQP